MLKAVCVLARVVPRRTAEGKRAVALAREFFAATHVPLPDTLKSKTTKKKRRKKASS